MAKYKIGPKAPSTTFENKRKRHLNSSMKQLDVVVSPPAFLWGPYLTLTNVIFALDICGL